MADTDPFQQNIIGVSSLVDERTNKVDGGTADEKEGVTGEKRDVLELDLDDKELLRLRNQWEQDYAPYEEKMKRVFERNKESYLGKKADGQWLAGEDNIAANIQFEAEETFLAATLSRNPEPVVFADNTPEGNKIAGDLKTMLQFHSEQLVIRAKLQFAVRQWSIYQLGVIKYGWNEDINDVSVDNRKIQDFVFDPEGYVNAYGEFVGGLGERIRVPAERLVELFPNKKADIETIVDARMGTKVTYTEWWTDKFCFYTFKDIVLDKHKNQFFKYSEPDTDLDGKPRLDENDQPVMTKPRNHFATPKKPYTFLSVYSLQDQPHDNTGLIEQNIPNQHLITKRTNQIDFNVSTANNSFAFSEDNFNQETAKQAATARKHGNPILIPSGGPIANAVLPLNAQSLPADVFNGLEISKNDLRTSWGVQGITSQPGDEDQTARGMILNQAHDTTRIGGGIGEKISGVASGIFNWLTQLYHVFYDEQHFAAIMGNAKAVEYATLSLANFDRQLIVGVAPDSMKPKDEVSQMNMAQALFDKGAIGPKTLLTMLDFPDPDESAADGLMYKLDPMTYFQLNFPEYAARLQTQMQQNALNQAQQQATATSLNETAKVAAQPPEVANGEPPAPFAEPASAALSNVPLPA